MFSPIRNACQSLFNGIKEMIRTWTKPATFTLAVGAIADLSHSKTDLLVENAILHQQLIVLKRSIKRPKFTTGDQIRLTLLAARFTNFWESALHIVQPDTILRWHRDMFRRFWKLKSATKSREPCIPPETIELIKQMARENHTWGAEKIQGELLKLDIKVGKPTIQKYMKQARQTTGGQSWSTFLKNHAPEIWACDFTVTHDLLFRPIYLFVIIAHHSREIIHSAVTRHRTDAWVAQQLREATPWNRRPRFLIRDNDKKYGKQFSAVTRSSGIKELLTPLKSPRANAICMTL